MDTGLFYLIAVLLISFSVVLTRKTSKTLAPSPRGLPVVGHLHLHFLREPFHRTLESLSQRLGPVLGLRLGRQRLLIVSSPAAVEQCLAQNDVVFSNRPPLLAGELLGYNNRALLWASYGDLWRNLRRAAVLGSLSPDRIKKSTCIRVEEARFVAREVQLLAARGSNKVDVNKAAFLYTRSVVMRMVAGKSLASVGPHPEELFHSTPFMMLPDFFPVLRWFGCARVEERLGLDRDLFLQALIDDKKVEGKTTSSTPVLLDDLLSLQKQDPHYYTDDILKGIILIILTSGTTLARTIEWALSLLLNHPHALQKARSEIDLHVGIHRLVDDSDLSCLNFLRCVVNETLRLYPVAPLLFPHYSSADTTVSGYHVDKGTTLLVNVWALHHDPTVWEAPLHFKPERFEGKQAADFRFKFLPFGMGRRACPASNLGMRSIMMVLATWIQCFDWDHAQGGVVSMEESGGNVTIPKTQHLQAICTPRPHMAHVLSNLLLHPLNSGYSPAPCNLGSKF